MVSGFVAQDVNLLGIGEVGEATGAGDGLEHGHSGRHIDRPSPLNLAKQEDLFAVDLGEYDGDVRVLYVLFEPGRDLICQLQRSHARGLNIAEKRHRDHAVRPDEKIARQGRLFPYGDGKNIGRADHIAVGRSCAGYGQRDRLGGSLICRLIVLSMAEEHRHKECGNEKFPRFHSATPFRLDAGWYSDPICLSL